MFVLYIIISVITSFLLFYNIAKNRSLLVKPSIWFLFFFNIQIQWSAVYNFVNITKEVKDESIFLVLTQIFPLVMVWICLKSFKQSSKIVWNRIGKVNYSAFLANRTIIYWLIILSFIIVSIYLAFVPLAKTGFYNNFKGGDALEATMARENSLKLLPFTWLKYLYVFYQQSIAIIAASLLLLYIIAKYQGKKYFAVILYIVVILFILFGAVLPGERLSGIIILFGMFITFFFQNKAKFNLLKITAVFILILIPAIIIQIKKYNLNIDIDTISSGFQTIVLDRILSVPLKTGITWIAHVENHGYWGVTGIPKLSEMLGYESINIPNLMMNEYFNVGSIDSAYLNTSFVFAYFSYFKWAALPFLFFFVYILDYVLLFFKTLKPNLLLPTIITVNISCISLISSDYTTLFLSHGFLTTVILAYYLNKITINKIFNFKENKLQ